MRYSKHIGGAAIAALAAAIATTAASAQSAPSAQAPAAAAGAGTATAAPAPNWGPVTDPDALIELNNQQFYTVTRSLDQRGCLASAKVDGSQWVTIAGYHYGGCLARGADANVAAATVLTKAAQTLGLAKLNAYGAPDVNNAYLVVGDTIPMMRTEGSGTWNGEKVGIRMDWDYRVPGVRLYITHADKSQDIYVAADPSNPPTGRIGHLEQPELFGNGAKNWTLAAWQEKPVGVYSGPSGMGAEDLIALAMLMPTNIILEGRDAADRITTAKAGQADTLTVPVPALGGASLVATLDADGHPVHAEVKANGKNYAADFSDYQNDRMEVGAFLPHHVVLQVDGKPLADYRLDFHHVNPYLVFPVPSQVTAQK